MRLFDFFRSKTKSGKTQLSGNLDIEHLQHNKYCNNRISFSSTTTIIEVLTFIKENTSLVGVELNKPASTSELDFFEKNKITLPQDFKTLYSFSDGFETDEDLFRLIPLKEIIDNGNDEYCISEASFHFTEYMIYADMWTVEINLNDIENYKIYNKADNIVYLTNSLTEFLCVFINKGIYDGLYQWREDRQKA